MFWSVYLKTTETCQLNCKHCFTSGSAGAKIYWNTTKIVDWIHRFREEKPAKGDGIHLEFHGGEPFLVPVGQMRKVYDACDGLWDNMSWGATTNLVYKLKDQHKEFIKGPLRNRLGTSWDRKIRFENQKQYNLWHKNVKSLLADGVTIRLFISLTKDTLAKDPIVLLRWCRRLGVQEVSLERLTNNGNARQASEIFPSNKELDAYFLKMHQQIVEYGARDWFDNDFMENVYAKFEKTHTTCGTFCRDCETKLFTINGDGTISGCPNSAPEFQFGTLDDSIKTLINSPRRIRTIIEEKMRNPNCLQCPVAKFCGGDCHQLGWEGDVCGAPKSLMMELAKNV